MKRIYTSYTDPGEGAVFRELAACFLDPAEEASSSSEGLSCAECIDTDPVGIITGVGCSSFPVSDNNYGALPTFFAGDVDIDTYGYDSRFEDISTPYPSSDPTCPTPFSLVAYPDLWSQLEGVSGLQEEVLEDNCYCPGSGIRRPTITIGKPNFPRVNPLPYFAFPNVSTTAIRAREINLDGPYIPGECCPGPSSEPDHIHAEIVNGELRLQRKKRKTDLDRVYRADDTDESFQLKAGFPKDCCMKDDCAPEGGPETYVLRNLHFPRWPGPNSVTSNYDVDYNFITREPRNPYGGGSDAEEPLGLIPRVVDLQCHDDGLLYVYYANDIIHDGVFAGLQWNTLPPRSTTLFRPANQAPIAPEDLEVNRDYQDRTLFDDFTPIGAICEEKCEEAAVVIGKTDEACNPACPPESLMCTPSETRYVATGTGDTESEASVAALQAAVAMTPGGCSPDYYPCYVYWEADDTAFKAAVAFCCP